MGPQDPAALKVQKWTTESRAVAATVGRVNAAGVGGVVTTGRLRFGGREPASLATRFELGSITKAVTGTLLADMVLQGEVALDDPVSRYLPGWTVPAMGDRPITLLDLATHTSGLPRMPAEFNAPDPEQPYAIQDADSLRRQLASSRLASAPGTRYAYSNLGFAVLGAALANAAGRSWATLVQDRVLAPLGMRRAVVGDAPGDFAVPHTARFIPIPAWKFEAYAPAGAIRATGADLVTLARALLLPDSSRVLRALALATISRRPTGNGADSVGLGWHVTHRGNLRIVWHNGGTGGTRSWVGASREADRGAAFATNAPFNWVDAVGLALVTGDSLPEPPVVEPVRLVPVSAEALEGLVGRYQFSTAAALDVTRRGDTLLVQLTGQQPVRVVPVARDTFLVTVVDARIAFERGADGRATAVTLRQGGADQRATRTAVEASSSAVATPPLVILVRHAEKVDESRDPALSAAGMARAAALDSALAGYPIRTIIVTPFERTRATAAPVATRRGITPIEIPVTGGVAAHAKAVAQAVLAAAGPVLVVGHSNTIGAIIAALGGGDHTGDLCDNEYQALFLLQPSADRKPTMVIKARYGAADPPATACPAMQ